MLVLECQSEQACKPMPKQLGHPLLLPLLRYWALGYEDERDYEAEEYEGDVVVMRGGEEDEEHEDRMLALGGGRARSYGGTGSFRMPLGSAAASAAEFKAELKKRKWGC